MCGWCPVSRPDLRRLLEQRGFVWEMREWLAEQEMDFYYLARNEQDPSIKDCRYASTAGQSVASRASIQTTTP